MPRICMQFSIEFRWLSGKCDRFRISFCWPKQRNEVKEDGRWQRTRTIGQRASINILRCEPNSTHQHIRPMKRWVFAWAHTTINYNYYDANAVVCVRSISKNWIQIRAAEAALALTLTWTAVMHAVTAPTDKIAFTFTYSEAYWCDGVWVYCASSIHSEPVPSNTFSSKTTRHFASNDDEYIEMKRAIAFLPPHSCAEWFVVRWSSSFDSLFKAITSVSEVLRVAHSKLFRVDAVFAFGFFLSHSLVIRKRDFFFLRLLPYGFRVAIVQCSWIVGKEEFTWVESTHGSQ